MSAVLCFVYQVACGGCHMIVTAYPRQENGHIGNGDDIAEEDMEQTLKSDTLDLSVSARVRRRNTVVRLTFLAEPAT